MNDMLPGHLDHPRRLGAFRYVYAVLSRRARGVSVGINLSPHKACNFDCTYCQVDRTTPGPEKRVDLDVLREELRDVFTWAADGRLFDEPRFRDAPIEQRRLVDVAFSGDGEPTSEAWFPQAADIVIDERTRAGHTTLPVRVITNATQLDEPRVAAALRRLDDHGLDVWAKLDAGTEPYYRLVDRTRIPFDRVLANLAACTRSRTTTIQSLFARHHGEPPGPAELDAWAERLRELIAGGGRIGWVQVHTVSRPPAETYVSALMADELDPIAERARRAVPGARVEVFRGSA